MAALVAETRRVQGGNLADLEATLTAQAVTLNAMFTQLAYQSSRMTILDQIDRFTRLALKAQGQCRATIEALALLKNPPAVFARQANIAHGPQQVNTPGFSAPREPQSPSRAENLEIEQSKLLEAQGEWLDADRRAQHARAIKRWRPWEYSTGPQTVDGKARSARNADRGGQWRVLREMAKTLNAAMRAQRDVIVDLSPPRQRHQGSSGRRA